MSQFGDLDAPGTVPSFLASASVMALAFVLAIWLPCFPPGLFWVPALTARFVLLGSMPGTDIYRYIWEGSIQGHGFSPYCLAPAAAELAPFRDAAWEIITYKHVTAIYPPAAELAFAAVAAFSDEVLVFKSAFLAADLIICFLLVRQFGRRRALVYGWNPLVIYSFAGGGHYDSWFLLALVGAWLLWERRNTSWRHATCAVGLIGLAVAFKWVSLPVLGWVLWRIRREHGLARSLSAAIIGMAPLAVSWAIVNWGSLECPILPADFSRTARSAELIPAIVGRFLPEPYASKSNEIYLGLFLLLSFWLLFHARSLARATQSVLMAALLTTPMFHAWYATWFAPFAARTRSRAAVAFSLSSFTYFWLHHTVSQPGGVWKQSLPENLLLWSPLLAGLAWDHFFASKVTHARAKRLLQERRHIRTPHGHP
jgi:hypothetical protein